MEGWRAVGERIQDHCLAFMKGGPYVPACSSGSPTRTQGSKSGWPGNDQIDSVQFLQPTSPPHHLSSCGPGSSCWFLSPLSKSALTERGLWCGWTGRHNRGAG